MSTELPSKQKRSAILYSVRSNTRTPWLPSCLFHIHFSVGKGLCGWIWRNRVEKLTTVNSADDLSLADNFYINALRKCILLSLSYTCRYKFQRRLER